MATNNYFSIRSARRQFCFFDSSNPDSERIALDQAQSISKDGKVVNGAVAVWNPTAMTRRRGILAVGECPRVEKKDTRQEALPFQKHDPYAPQTDIGTNHGTNGKGDLQ